MNAHITLLSVISDEGELREALGVPKKNEEELKRVAREKLDEIAADYSAKSGIEMSTMIDSGVIYEEIHRVSELIEADLVVMGTNGKPSNLKKRFIGSNAYRTAVLVKVPVISVKGVRKINKIENIIFPLILGGQSKEKVGTALHYARLFNARIMVVSVLNDEQSEKALKVNQRQVVNFITDHGVECSGYLIEPGKHKGIIRNTLNFAYENDGDLIMITEDDRDRDITDYFLGTDVQAMIYHSEIPVMSITPRDRKWSSGWSAI